jgi:hypothetical protein
MLEHTEKPQVVATAQIMATSHLVEMAAHLGKMADAAAYNVSLTKMKLAYHSKYWDSEAKSYIGGSQTANLKLSQFVNRQATIISIMLSSILCYPYRPPLGAKGPNQSINQSISGDAPRLLLGLLGLPCLLCLALSHPCIHALTVAV